MRDKTGTKDNIVCDKKSTENLFEYCENRVNGDHLPGRTYIPGQPQETNDNYGHLMLLVVSSSHFFITLISHLTTANFTLDFLQLTKIEVIRTIKIKQNISIFFGLTKLNVRVCFAIETFLVLVNKSGRELSTGGSKRSSNIDHSFYIPKEYLCVSLQIIFVAVIVLCN